MYGVVLVLYAGFGNAAENNIDPQLIQTLMDKSGLNKQLEQMPHMIQAGMVEANEETKTLTPEALNEMSVMAAQVFDAVKLRQSVQNHIQLNMTETETRAALAWLNSPLGDKIAKAEEKAATPEAYTEMLNMADQLIANAARVELVKKLDDAVRATETGVAMVMNTQTALIALLTSKMDPEERLSVDDIELEVKKNKVQIQSAVQPQTIISFLYSYRDLTDAEISQYLKFAESGSGRKYHAVVARGFNQALAGAARELGSQIEERAGHKVNHKTRQTV
jgi:hypothetical protein